MARDTDPPQSYEQRTADFWDSWPSLWPYVPGRTGVCPHCMTGVQFQEPRTETFTWLGRLVGESSPRRPLRSPPQDLLGIISATCPICYSVIVSMRSSSRSEPWLLWPWAIQRAAPPEDLPAEIVRDYQEAAAVLSVSTRASAALSRRCLQSVLRSAGKVKPSRIYDEIEEAIKSLPPYIAKDLHGLRELGNFGAHPTKSTDTGEIVDVEVGEAEWTLNILDLLFDYYYAKPEISKKHRRAISEKLRAAGRPALPGDEDAE